MAKKSTAFDFRQLGDGEQGFSIPLNTQIQGKDTKGKDFDEKTVLTYISHSGSSFWMANSVVEGSELRLIIDLPPKLSDEKNLKLIIKGKVVFVEAPKNEDPRHRVSLKFENKYIIKDDEKIRT
ncbi:MAG: PilZ domain-containing protein [Candidatus Aminicenantes bacterium]|nr:MAG: PilZ domain-containing protein [Candidatus Aminicenantes bacterium]